MKYIVILITLICSLNCRQLKAVIAIKSVDHSTQNINASNTSTPNIYNHKKTKKKLKSLKRKKAKKKRNWRRNLFKKKKKEYKIKNKWLRISLKILIYSTLIMITSLILALAGWTHPHTFLGSDGIVTFFYILFSAALFVGLASLLSVIIFGIVLLFK